MYWFHWTVVSARFGLPRTSMDCHCRSDQVACSSLATDGQCQSTSMVLVGGGLSSVLMAAKGKKQRIWRRQSSGRARRPGATLHAPWRLPMQRAGVPQLRIWRRQSSGRAWRPRATLLAPWRLPMQSAGVPQQRIWHRQSSGRARLFFSEDGFSEFAHVRLEFNTLRMCGGDLRF